MIRPRVCMIPIIPNVFTGPSHEPSPPPIASVTAVRNQIAFHGVFQRGCTFPRIGGPTIASGRLRFGFSDSSPSGATDSKPDRARIVKTIPRYNPLPLGMLPGLNDLKLKPPEPGDTRPEIISATKTPTSTAESV